MKREKNRLHKKVFISWNWFVVKAVEEDTWHHRIGIYQTNLIFEFKLILFSKIKYQAKQFWCNESALTLVEFRLIVFISSFIDLGSFQVQRHLHPFFFVSFFFCVKYVKFSTFEFLSFFFQLIKNISLIPITNKKNIFNWKKKQKM